MKTWGYILLGLWSSALFAGTSPAWLDQAKKSLYRIVPLKTSPQKLTTSEFSDYESSPGFLGTLYQAQGKSCRQNQATHCPLYFDNMASSFLLQKDKKFFVLTAHHTFSEDKKTPEFLLFNAEGTMVFDTRLKPNAAKWSVKKPVDKSNPGTQIASDWIEIEIDQRFDSSLEWGNEKDSLAGLSVYALGWLKSSLELTDARSTVELGHTTAATLKWDEKLDLVGKYLDQMIFSIPYKVNHAASGSPILNDQGRVVGIISFTLEDKDVALGPNLKTLLRRSP